MQYRDATIEDAALLGDLNHQLIEDEGHRNPMSREELAERMVQWLESDYRAILFEQGSATVAYALFRNGQDSVYLRQFFVQRPFRRSGVGKRCIEILRSEVFPQDKRITVDVLSHNSAAISFWRAVGFSDYCLTLEASPKRHAADNS